MSQLELIEKPEVKNSFNSIEEIISDLKNGKMVIIVDDESRENEGDLIILAEKITDESINFMAQHGRGLICLAMPKEQCMKLELQPMTSKNKARYSTNFTVSIEAAVGVTTGISAKDRATTIKAAIKKDSKPDDVVSPGHIFPILAMPGGVLTRAGHTEASTDLAKLAGSEVPAAVIVEILNEDGTMARRNDLEKFAKIHNLKIASIDSLIKYRLNNEKTIQLELKKNYLSRFGEFTLFCFRETIGNNLHYALVKGEINKDQKDQVVDVRVHVANHMQDLLFVDNKNSGWTLDRAMQYISKSDAGVIVIINPEENDSSHDKNKNVLLNLESYLDNAKLFKKELSNKSKKIREVGVGSQILVTLGVNKMRVLSNQQKYTGLNGFSLNIVDNIEYTS